ncbi:uncharacterized protein LOC100890944 [Strongylocentrotus purpuratus]|uniref:Integrase catalytic domain-containing protein n=1 Tax=Strongylocentrotus purpuratus TaxID=7668 RepID=A0A7M7P0A9_STRPU|nr:uncharacterized protein LOC100890944 [Strongylocentrotus purpuratus]
MPEEEEAKRTRSDPKPTELGLQHQNDQRELEFRYSLRGWRQAANKLRAALSDEELVLVIKQQRDEVQAAMDKATVVQDSLSKIKVSLKLHDDSFDKIEEVEEQHAELMKQTHERVKVLQGGSVTQSTSSRHSSKPSPKRQNDCEEWVNAEPKDDPPTMEKINPRAQDIETGNSLAASLVDQMRISHLPPPEPTQFDGSPLQYPTWKRSYDLLIERREINAADKFYYLLKYIKGQPLQLVQGYALLGDTNSYAAAKMALERRYGDPFVLSSAYRDKLDSWPRISNRDGQGLRMLSDFVKQCCTAMTTIGNLAQLNDERENRKILAKLPDHLIVSWGRKVAHWKKTHGNFPSFHEFSDFIEEEANIACDPITSLYSVKELKVDKQRTIPGATSMYASTDQRPQHPRKGKKQEYVCVLCKENHQLGVCKRFLSMTLKERKTYVRDNGLCYGCLIRGHTSRECRRRDTCSVCKRRHPTSLHEDWNRSNQVQERDVRMEIQSSDHESSNATEELRSSSSHTTVNHMTLKKQAVKCSAVVPVWISQKGRFDERLIYALLDTQSDTTFLLESTKEAMNLQGSKVNLLLSTMSKKDERIPSEKIQGLTVRAHNSMKTIDLPAVYTRDIMPANREYIPVPEVAMSFPHLTEIAEELLPLQDCEVGLLIGYDCARALIPRSIILSPDDDDGPFGMKTDLGWCVVGISSQKEFAVSPDDRIGFSHRLITCEILPELTESKTATKEKVMFSHNVTIKEEISPSSVLRIMEADFSDLRDNSEPSSHNDVRFMNIMKNNVRLTEDGHYETPLPFKEKEPDLPNNRYMADKRLQHLKRKFERDSNYHRRYTEKMEALLEKGYAELAPEIKTADSPVWYIPHHGVIQPNKLRVVYDCSAQYKGESLNDYLLTGPDLTNALVGVLCRFRRDEIAFSCDIKEMFHQFKVREDHRDYLRYLWWKDGDILREPIELRMTVHLFGASSSPGCSNFCLKQTATDHADEFGNDVKDFIHRDFYVDDGLKSVPSTKDAIDLVSRTRQLCKKSGLHLHKFISNSREVMESVPEPDRAKGVSKTDLMGVDSPMEKALGVLWCVESDTLKFRLTLHDKPLTRRGVLATVMSIYDPLGLLAPVVLRGKQILQELCRKAVDWDDQLPDEQRSSWEKWRADLHNLDSISIQRCYKPAHFGEVKTTQLHHFSDASTTGYGECTYLRLTNDEGKVHCTLLMGKARVVPLKPITVPRLELTAAVVSVRVSAFLQREFVPSDTEEFYWTDSNVVMGYVSNDSKRFHVFVANRVHQIRQHSSPSQWRHVGTQDNPADIASRGATVNQLLSSSWFTGPKFLWESNTEKFIQGDKFDVKLDDPEVKKAHANVVHGHSKPCTFEIDRLDRFSSWHRAKRAVANCMRLKAHLRRRCRERGLSKSSTTGKTSFHGELQKLTTRELNKAQCEILKTVQRDAFSNELTAIQNQSGKGNEMNANKRHRRKQQGYSRFHRLDPFIDADGILRVGGRLSCAEGSYESKHPAILPQDHHITELIIRHCHIQTAHQGRGMTINQLRSSGFWVLSGSSTVSRLIRKCVTCRRLRGESQWQKMSNLPKDRVEPTPPFTYSCMDVFGPWVIKEGRKELKRYGLLFSCMVSRAVHIETLNSMTTDSFINALRRFLSIRGPVRQLRSDRGTIFIGAEAELGEGSNTHQDKIQEFLLRKDCDYIHFKFNVPSASHMGGVWERQIRSIRRVLETLLYEAGQQLDDESLRTLMNEAAAIVNSRPLTVDNLNDPTHPEPLTPNHLLTMKTNVLLPPPGHFQREDLYSRKRWRRVQHLANEFWKRWKREFLQSLQSRQKWTCPQRETRIGDVVIMKDDNPRNQWTLARVVDVYPSSDNHVRKVKLVMGDPKINSRGKRIFQQRYFERPIHKLILLVAHEDQGKFPDKEPQG